MSWKLMPTGEVVHVSQLSVWTWRILPWLYIILAVAALFHFTRNVGDPEETLDGTVMVVPDRW